MRNTPPTIKLGASLFFAACGMAALIHTHPQRLESPEWVALFAVGLVGFAGVCVAAQALGLSRLVRWLVCVLLASMAVVPAWIAFGPGRRQCTMVSPGLRSTASEVVCRGAFGAGALLLVVLFVVAVRAELRARHAA